MANGAPTGIGYLDGRRLGRALNAGIARVVAEQRALNDINVFPVPDGDTGTNLAHTLTAVAEALTRPRDNHCGDLFNRIADAALDGARGNSGAIMAQYFHGFSETLSDDVQLTAMDLATASRAEYTKSPAAM